MPPFGLHRKEKGNTKVAPSQIPVLTLFLEKGGKERKKGKKKSGSWT